MPAVQFSQQMDVTDVAVHGDTAHVDIWYPRNGDRPKYLKIGLMDVRASDGIRIYYDFDRDGFVVEQPKPLADPVGEDGFMITEEWIEVGFFPSWRFDNRENGLPSEPTTP